jgi:hypothetical protein
MNIVILEGVVHRRNVRLVGDTSVVEFEVRTQDEGRSMMTVPMVAYAGQDVPADGELVVAHGQVRLRFFRASGTTVARTEVVLSDIVGSARKRPRATLLRGVLSDLSSF